MDVAVSGVAADSLGARRIGDLAFAAQQAEPPVSVLVSDDEIVRGARRALERATASRPSIGAATAYAALLSGRYTPQPGERVAVVDLRRQHRPVDPA